jgi:hypothetical protein
MSRFARWFRNPGQEDDMKWITAALVATIVATPAYAEPANPGRAAHTGSIRTSIEHVRFGAHSRDWAYVPAARPTGKASAAQKASAAFAIGSLGVMGGAWLGARLGGLLGGGGGDNPLPNAVLIGAPIGGVAGAVLGWRLVR